MANISLRIDEATRDELEALAQGQDQSVSEVIRTAIETFLGRDVKPDRSAPSTLSRRERHQLSLLHQVLEATSDDEDDAAYHRRRAQVLERGYTGDYGDEFAAIEAEIPLSDCKLLWDILDMFRLLRVSVASVGLDAVTAVEAKAQYALEFGGFDLNDSREGGLLSYARHMIATDRWTDLAEYFDDEHERGNSHSPRLAAYQRMLVAFQPIWRDKLEAGRFGGDRFNLTVEELAQVASAWSSRR